MHEHARDQEDGKKQCRKMKNVLRTSFLKVIRGPHELLRLLDTSLHGLLNFRRVLSVPVRLSGIIIGVKFTRFIYCLALQNTLLPHPRPWVNREHPLAGDLALDPLSLGMMR